MPTPVVRVEQVYRQQPLLAEPIVYPKPRLATIDTVAQEEIVSERRSVLRNSDRPIR
jgi:hypothetical protein